MYGTRRYYRARRKREEIRGYLRTLAWVLTVICILAAAVAVAVQTNASRVIAAEISVAEPAVSVDESRMIDMARAAVTEPMLAVRTAAKSAAAQTERVIVIDPGHGGMDGGCVFENIVEKDINRKIAHRVADKLEEMGYEVVLARKEDELVDKTERVEEANRINARLYVSIHQNSCEDESVSGIETWYDDSAKTGEDKRLAQLIQQETVRATGARGRELVPDTELCVTSKTLMPACLIETGFLSNKKERGKLNTEEYQEQIAEGIARGIEMYLNKENGI